MADRGAMWHDAKINALLEIWSGEVTQAQLSGSYRNETVFQLTSDMLEQWDIHCIGRQCRNRIKSLEKQYKKITDKLHNSGSGNG